VAHTRRASKPRTPATQAAAKPLRGIDVGRRGGIDRWLLPFAIPLVVVPLLGYVLYVKARNSNAYMWVPAFIMVGAVGLAALAYNYAGPRRRILRIHHAVSMLYIVGSLAVHVAVGPAAWAWLWFLCGMAWGVSWLIPRFDTVRGHGDDTHDQSSGIDDMLGMTGARAKPVSIGQIRERWKVKLANGDDAEVVQKAARRIASLRGLAPGSVRAVQDRRNAAQADVTILRHDVLADPIPWPGPSRFGGSIADPIRKGLYEDGEFNEFALFGYAGKAAPAIGVTVGMPGAGKTNGAKIAAAEVMTRRDAIYWHGDPIKGAQSWGPLQRRTDWYVSSKAGCLAMLAAIDRLVPVRAALLGARSLEEWQQGCGIPALVVNIEEASRVIGDSAQFVALSQSIRSVGIFLMTSQQRASATTYDTDARHNLGLAIVYGTGDAVSAGMVLDESVLDAGVRPDMWRNDWPGRCVVTAPSIARERWTIEARDYSPSADDLEMWMIRADNELGPAPSFTAQETAALGTVYTSRKGKPLNDTPTLHVVTTDESDDEVTDEVDDEETDGIAPFVADFSDLSDEDHALFDGAGDPREPIDTDAEGLDFDFSDLMPDGPPLPNSARPEAFGRMLSGFLVRAGGVSVSVTAGELADAWFDIPGVSRSSLSRLLSRAVRLGAMTNDTYGHYVILPGADSAFVTYGTETGN